METMTQEDKELLLNDLCARLPYGVMLSITHNEYTNETFNARISAIDYCGEIKVRYGFEEYEQVFSLEQIKPYLFPLSSMTDEQKEELKCEISKQTEILIERMKNDDCGIDCGKYHFHSLLELEWCIKNHFDYRGLIPKDLAIDATGLNIY